VGGAAAAAAASASAAAASSSRMALASLSVRQAAAHLAPTLGLSLATIVGLNLLGFTITAFTRTHLITDLIGTGAFVVSAVCTFLASPASASTGTLMLRPVVLTVCTVLWGVRLASYLFYRILHTRHDARLAAFFPPSPSSPWTADRLFKLAMFWSLQSAWAFLVLLPVTVCHALPRSWHRAHPLGPASFVFLWLWSVGFILETVADAQKFAFRANRENDGKFMSTGVFALCRYPNYAGEIALWWATFGLALPVFFTRWGFPIIISPLFTTLLLRYVSGVPLHEKRYDAVYKDNEEYQRYKRNTNMLIPELLKYKQAPAADEGPSDSAQANAGASGVSGGDKKKGAEGDRLLEKR